MVHVLEDVDLLQLHFKFLTAHGHHTIYPGVKFLHDFFDFFHKTIENNFNYSSCLLNVFRLLQLVMIDSAAIVTCEHSFSFRKLIKSNIRSTMMDQRFNNLIILNHYKNKIKGECVLISIMKEFAGRDEKRVRNFCTVVGGK